MEVLKRLCSGLQHGKPVSLLVFVGWARSRLLGQNVCLCPELSVKTGCPEHAASEWFWVCMIEAHGVPVERTQCVSFAMKKDHSGRCWRFWDDFRAWISVIIYSTSICFKPGLLPSNFKWNILGMLRSGFLPPIPSTDFLSWRSADTNADSDASSLCNWYVSSLITINFFSDKVIL